MILFEPLLQWFSIHARECPWRTPIRLVYPTLVSEMMSQQTVLPVVIPKFQSFMKTFPTMDHLAEASLESVYEAWAGLGYYRRARNLKKACEECATIEIPRDYEGWLKKPGCGEYTSAMIASLCFKEKVLAMDGNVTRVLARVFAFENVWGQGRLKQLKRFGEEAFLNFPTDIPGTLNEAMIELGALVCKPQNPACNICPLSNQCKSYQKGLLDKIPGVKPRKKKIEVELWCPVPETKEGLTNKRPFLKEHVGFPLLTEAPILVGYQFLGTVKHTITHHNLKIHVYKFKEGKTQIDHIFQTSLDQKIAKISYT